MPSMKTAFASHSLGIVWIFFCAAQTLAAVPAVVVDAQQTIGAAFANPQSIAVAPNGTVYVADLNNDRVVQLSTHLPAASTESDVYTGPSGVSAPLALAVDGVGDLYIADLPSPGTTGRIIEVMADGRGTLTHTVRQIYLGGTVTVPVSLAVDSAATVFVGDVGGNAGTIYAIPYGGAPQKVNITGLPPTFFPGALVAGASGDLYIADSAATHYGVYMAPAAGGAVRTILTGSFDIDQPTGLALDGNGNLFVAAYLGSNNTLYPGEQIIEVPGASPATQSAPYLLPASNLDPSSGIALDPAGNLDIAEVGNGQNDNGIVTQLNFLNAVSLGAVSVFAKGPGVTFNFAFNAPTTFAGFRAVTTGDLGARSDVAQVAGGTCQTQRLRGQTEYTPYLCSQTFQATPQYAGMRMAAIQVKGSGGTVLTSSPVYALGDAAAEVAYPLDVSTSALGLIQPQGVAISGFDRTVYIADLSGGKVYSIAGLNGASATAVFTGAPGSATALSAPSAVAINGEGDLYIADFNLGQVIVVPTTTGEAPYVLNTGGLLQHPIALTLDYLGNVYIGDAGPDGDGATTSNPGYLVFVPYHGVAFKAQVPGVAVVFPQALAISPINGDVLIGDGGDISASAGQIVRVPSNGSAASVVSVTTPAVPANPSGLTFDAAGNLYVLDGTAGTITVVSPVGASALLPLANTAALSYPSALASSAGAQSLVVANLGGGTANSLVYLNGNSATMAFGNQGVHSESIAQSVTLTNIGNEPLTLNNNYYSPRPIPRFTPAGSNSCAGGDTLTLSSPSCIFSLQFDPAKAGAISQTVTINSNAYNSGTPLIHLTGTGAAANVRPSLPANQSGRKSFAAAGRNANIQ